LCQKHIDGVVLADNASISAAIKDMFTETRTILEPAGALALAGAKAYLARNGLKVPLCCPCIAPQGTTVNAYHQVLSIYGSDSGSGVVLQTHVWPGKK
jgi:threonine dehydratase